MNSWDYITLILGMLIGVCISFGLIGIMDYFWWSVPKCH